MSYNYNDWDWKKVRRAEKDGDMRGYCKGCGVELDLNDGGIYNCYRCGAILRMKEDPIDKFMDGRSP